MNTTAANKIKHLTGKRPVEVREWAFVYWVKFSTGRPTLYSKKMVDRAAAIEVVRKQSEDCIIRDTVTGKAYATRPMWPFGASIKELPKGTAINLNNFDFSMLPGEVVRVASTRKPQRVSHLISMVASAA